MQHAFTVLTRRNYMYRTSNVLVLSACDHIYFIIYYCIFLIWLIKLLFVVSCSHILLL